MVVLHAFMGWEEVRRRITPILIIAAALLVAAVILVFGRASSVSASNPFDITFPIAELGGCASPDACKTYCDDLGSAASCAAFARKHGLATEAQVGQAKDLPSVGPGGCNSESSCKTYCDDSSHTDECLAFAEKHNLLPREEIVRAKALAGKVGPGGCRGASCKDYCDNPTNQNECLKFAEDNGLLGATELRDIKKGREILERSGGGPGGCRSEQQCRAYCDDSTHLDECLEFGEKSGFLSKEEAARIRKLSGAGPGGCKGKDECRVYCDDPNHTEECVAFAVENGLISKDEAERAKKLAGKAGPGGCRGESQCRAYCDDPAHGDECLTFAEREGILPKEAVERAKKFRSLAAEAGPGNCRGERECRTFCENPVNQDACFKFAKDQGLIAPEELKRFERGKGLEERVKTDGGPGGCRDEASCFQYCSKSANTVACLNFAVEHGGFSREEANKNFEDWKRYREYGDQLRNSSDAFLAPEGLGRPGFPPPLAGQVPPGFTPPGLGVPGFSNFTNGPGGCSSPQECGQYCSKSENGAVCRDFFRGGRVEVVSQGPSSAATVEFGPGGCRGLTECLRYCQDPSHASECSRFGGPPPVSGQLPSPGQFPGAPGSFSPPTSIPRFCPQVYEPECGVDGRTYGNRCEAGYVPIAYPGVCRDSGYRPQPFPGGCTTVECAQQYCSEPTRTDIPECRALRDRPTASACPSGYEWVPNPGYCRPSSNQPPQPSACISLDTCRAVCYNASTFDYNTPACLAFRQSQPGPPPPGTCPFGYTWVGTTGGSTGYCELTPPAPGEPPRTGGCTSQATCEAVCFNPANALEYNSSACIQYRAARSSPSSCPSGYHYMSPAGSGAGYCMSDTSGTVCQPLGGGATYTCPTDTGTPPPNDSCSTLFDILPGCHYMPESPDVRFNGSMDQYVVVGTRTVKSCSTNRIPGCAGGPSLCPSDQYWNGTACVPSTTQGCDASLTALLGTGCHYMYNDASGNALYCDGPMTKSAKRGDTTTQPGCQPGGTTPTPVGQREQVWNALGLRSWIRSDADPARIERLKQACVNVSSGSNIWMPGSGDYASPDFGMPDPAKCQQATSCPSGQYWNGTSCVSSTSTTCPSGQYWNGTSCVNSTASSCPSSLIALLGSGCHQMYTDAAGNSIYCDGPMTQSAKAGDTVAKPGCTSSTSTSTTCPSGQYWYVPPSGGAGYCKATSSTDCPSGQYWNGTSCVSSTTTTCPSGQYWYVPPGGGAGYCQSSTSTTCPSGQYWNGTACVNSTTTTGSCPAGWHSMGSYCMSDSDSSQCQPFGGGAAYPCSGGTTSTSCPSGQYWYVPPGGGAGYCQSSTSTACPSGQYWNGTSCVSSTTTTCPSGQYWNGTSCVSSTTTTTTTCPSGQYWNGTSCVTSSYTPPTTTTCPSDQYWNGTSCVTSTPPSTTTTTCPSDQYWNGTSCVTSTSPSTTTTTCPSGQYWNGTACVSSTTSPSLVGTILNAFVNAFVALFTR